MSELINPELMRIALDRVEGFAFERFANEFFPALVGRDYVPLGGVKDGGADAFDESLHEESRKAGYFYQASVGAEVEGKIRKTITRLREFGREPRALTYITSRSIKYIDTLETTLTEELDVTVRIRDATYLTSHVNDGPRTRAAFDHHLRHYTNFLKSVNASHLIAASSHVREPAVYVFLSQEIQRRSGDDSLVSAMVDSLILWGLEDTDPDEGKFCTHAQLRTRICDALPTVETLVVPRLERRLRVLTAKNTPEGRRVRWHKAEDKFCLPYETRKRLTEENQDDEALRIRVLDSLDDRVRSTPREGLGETGIRQSAELSLRALQLTFEREGLEFAAFLRRDQHQTHATISDSIAAALDESGINGNRRLLLAEAVFDAVRGVLYESRPTERDYLHKLSRTYTLLFTLNTEPRLIEYFQEMAGDFYLYVGADQIVRALSEHYLSAPDQMTKNTLLLAARTGAKMVLTETALEEVVHHLITCDHEFKNVIKGIEPHMTYELARNSSKILIRAYLYASMNESLGARRPKNWPAFVQQFIDYNDLHKPQAFDGMRNYLQRAFGLTFESRSDLGELTDLKQLERLTSALSETKDPRLARNDALVALAVYGRRHRAREQSAATEFGYRTWWLTGETAILKHTGDLVAKNGGSRYIMRPDFLLNFLTLAPAASQARDAFSNVFPSLLSMTLARRIPEDAFKKIIDQVDEAQLMDEARRGAAMAKCADRLKSDFQAQYLRSYRDKRNANQAQVDELASARHADRSEFLEQPR